MPPSIADKRRTFRRLHERGCFVLPNPWDVGTARYLQHLGFEALATTSAGFAFTRGLPDGALGCPEMLEHIAEIVKASDLPVNADFENGFADDPEEAAENVRLCLETGVAGLSLEDRGRGAGNPAYDLTLARERVRAACKIRDKVAPDAIIVARCEFFLMGRTDIEEVIDRLQAFCAEGADCVYAPGLRTRDDIESLVNAVAPLPVNVLASSACEFTQEEFAGMGVRRLSVGGSLARAAWGAVMRAAQEMMTEGRFAGLTLGPPQTEINELFQEDLIRRNGPL